MLPSKKNHLKKVMLFNLFLVGSIANLQAKSTFSSDDYLTLYPGVLSEKEQSLVDEYNVKNKALKSRGPIDVKALVSGNLPKNTPGIGPVVKVTREWLQYNNGKYDPENKLLNDANYARSLGYKDIMAFPTFGAHDDTFMLPYPPNSRDSLLVSDLNHNITNYLPVYPGDTLYLVANSRNVVDLTPEKGSKYRSSAIETKGSIYNQDAKKVSDVIFRVTESIKVVADQSTLPKNRSFFDIWESPNWLDRKEHTYTDADWTKIKTIWKNEKLQGETPLYWEDVAIGDYPTWTADGPIESSAMPIPPWGMGSGGSRTLKQEILANDGNVELVRGKDGIYRTVDKTIQIPVAPTEGSKQLPPMASDDDSDNSDDAAIVTTDIHGDAETRTPLVNYMGRDIAMRHIHNWMGHHGWVQNIRWSIMDPTAVKFAGKDVPRNPVAEHYIHRVPSLKGKIVNAHGLTSDLAIVKSYVYDKFIANGEHFADLVWWVETINGDIWQEGGVTIKLPSKNKLKKNQLSKR